MSDRVRRGKTRPRCANETSIPAQQDDPGNRGGLPGSLSPDGVLGAGGNGDAHPVCLGNAGARKAFRLRSAVFAWATLNHRCPSAVWGHLGRDGVQEGASRCTPRLLWRRALLPFCYPTRRHEILAGSTTGPCIWMMPWCGRLRIFFLPFKGAQFARTLAQSIDATELSVLRPGAPVPRSVCFNMRFHASTRVGAICFRYCAPTHCLGFS
jgi:hypothetical protein